MASSLKDQLLKTGVANKQQAHNVANEQRKKRKQDPKGATSLTDSTKEQARRLQAEKVARDRELNRHKQQEAERKGVAAQIRQLIELNRLPREDGEVPYRFVDGNVVRTIHVTEVLFDQLGHGVLAIVRFDDSYEIVSAVVAGKIGERDTSIIIEHGQPDPPEDADDPYAAYQVPDDLMW